MGSALFKELAAVFEKLEQTSSSISMITILADFLLKLSPEEARVVAYLLSGRVGPNFSKPEFGMADTLVVRALASASGAPLVRIQRLAVQTGDAGAVAALLLPNSEKKLSIMEVFDLLNEIAHASGKGAQATKIEKLAHLLRNSSAVEAKYIIRTVLGTHRIGVGEMTFLRALSKAYGGRSQDRNLFEYAYNVLSDLGEVAYRAAQGGIKALLRVKPTPGIPVRMMLATRIEVLDEVPTHLKGDMFVEYKYDGERMQIHRKHNDIHIFSRRLEDITHQYPEVVAHVDKNLLAKSAIVEGEVVAVDQKTKKMLPFQVLIQRKRKHQIRKYSKKVPVALFLFDILYVNGKSLLTTKLSERKRLLTKCIKTDNIVNIGTYIQTEELTEVERYFHEAVSQGAEGIVIKAASSPYQAGKRGWYWIKFKKEYEKELSDTFDVVVVGALYGKGSRAGSYGSLLTAAYDPVSNKYFSFTKVGAGLNDKLLRRLPKLLKPYIILDKHRLVEAKMKMDVWFEPAIVLEISGADLTISPVHTVAEKRIGNGGIALRFPRLLRIRDDKSAEQATTVGEIYSMYKERVGQSQPERRV